MNIGNNSYMAGIIDVGNKSTRLKIIRNRFSKLSLAFVPVTS